MNGLTRHSQPDPDADLGRGPIFSVNELDNGDHRPSRGVGFDTLPVRSRDASGRLANVIDELDVEWVEAVAGNEFPADRSRALRLTNGGTVPIPVRGFDPADRLNSRAP